jgi:hypothetical protein
MFTRRSLLSSGAAGVAAVTLAACASTTDPTTGVVTYGLSTAVVAYIQSAVNYAKQYIPTIESIAATAISMFGPQFASVVAIGTTAINTVINTLINLIPGVAPAAGRWRRISYRGVFVGWTTTHVPIYSER